MSAGSAVFWQLVTMLATLTLMAVCALLGAVVPFLVIAWTGGWSLSQHDSARGQR